MNSYRVAARLENIKGLDNVMSNLQGRCAKDWPALQVFPLIKKNLETLGLYL